MSREAEIARRYLLAKRAVIEAGYGAEVDWQSSLCLDKTTETDFIREAAWVVLCSGMKEAVVRQRFGLVSEAFLHWKSGEAIVANATVCRSEALKAFNHISKIDAITDIAAAIAQEGFTSIFSDFRQRGPSAFSRFPYIGPVTAVHLAKNLGADVSKPDRHLVLAAEYYGFEDAQKLCRTISNLTGDSVPVVDIVLWRYISLWKEQPLQDVVLWFSSRTEASIGLKRLRAWLRGDISSFAPTCSTCR